MSGPNRPSSTSVAELTTIIVNPESTALLPTRRSFLARAGSAVAGTAFVENQAKRSLGTSLNPWHIGGGILSLEKPYLVRRKPA
jgi:hypothetical protein